MNIINLTPHEINIYNEAGELIRTVPTSENVARVAETKHKTGEIDGIPFFITEYGEPEFLPPMQANTIYVVWGLFRSAFKREDVFQPGEVVRNEKNQIIGCVGLSQ